MLDSYEQPHVKEKVLSDLSFSMKANEYKE